MKKFLLSIFLVSFTLIAFGQIEEGTKFISGSFNYSSSTDETTESGNTFVHEELSAFSIMPSLGYMLSEKIGIGLRAGFSNTQRTNPDTDGFDQMGNLVSGENERINSTTSIGLFGRYYMPVAGDKLFFRLDLGFDVGFGTTAANFTPSGGTMIENDADVSTLNVGINPGFDYFIGEKWALQLNWGRLGYQSRTEEYDGGAENEVSGIGAEFDFSSVRLGATWFF
jgi:hypothetical protein